jgi:N-acetylmuramoyl-L-alanine amidase-like protein
MGAYSYLGSLGVSQRIPRPGKAPKIERRALRIADPVERLRYLRRETSRVGWLPGSPPQASWRGGLHAHFHRHRFQYLGGGLVVLVLATAPLSVPKASSEIFAREHRLLVPSADLSARASSVVPKVWLVEHSEALELYSNGLRVDLTFAVPNRPRDPFPIFSLGGAGAAEKTGTKPVGVVYHTTESHLALFEEDENHRLKQLGRNLLELIRQDHSYHYVIDRFGRVFRVVQESDVAFHSGNSVWADAEGVYVNLNESFLGVAFEAQTDAVSEVTPAQISAARVLTEMLRARYGIAPEDCVTHAQVSVNPLNMRIGAHTDWAGNFPFASLGLPDNYAIPLPSVYVFGFDYDSTFLESAGGEWKGLQLAVNQVERQSAAAGLSPSRYQAILRHRYKDIAAELKERSELRENGPKGHQEATGGRSQKESDASPPRAVIQSSSSENQGGVK